MSNGILHDGGREGTEYFESEASFTTQYATVDATPSARAGFSRDDYQTELHNRETKLPFDQWIIEQEKWAPRLDGEPVRYMSQICDEAYSWLKNKGLSPISPWGASQRDYDKDAQYEKVVHTVKLVRNEKGYILTARRTDGEDASDLLPDEETRKKIIDAANALHEADAFPRESKVHVDEFKASLTKELLSDFEDGYMYHDFADSDGMIGYVQVRNRDPDEKGRGKYFSYVYYDKGVGWLYGQPEQLPLYGQNQLSNNTRRVFVCEGPKAVAGALQQVGECRDHPWALTLSGTAIIGWPGGGSRHWDVDWSPLDRLSDDCDIIVVADNDDVGLQAAHTIVEKQLWWRRYRRLANDRAARRRVSVRVLEFPGDYAKGYDFADPWPDAASAPDLLGLASPPRYIGNARSPEVTRPTDEVCDRLKEHELAFQMAGQVTQIELQKSAFLKDPEDPEPDVRKKRAAVTYRAVVASEHSLIRPIEQVSRWEAFNLRRGRRGEGQQAGDQGEWVRVQVPSWLAKQVMCNPGGLDTLAGIVDYPILREGKLLSGNLGYDRHTGLVINSPAVKIAEWSDPKAALRFLLDEWLAPFPFRDRNDAIRALAVPLQMMLRPTEIREGGAPFPFCTAPEPKTGKSLLMRMLCSAVLGRKPPSAVFAKEEEELRKQFVGALMESPPVIFYDNVPNRWRVGTAFLDQYATEEAEYSFRILGGNANRIVSSLSTVVFLGNNIEPSGDTETRVYEIRLEKQDQQHPALELVPEFTRRNRGRILGALLAISRVTPLALPGVRFPDWVRFVGGPLAAVAEQPDLFVAMARATGEPDEETEGLREALVEIGRLALSRGGYVTCAQMLKDEACATALHAMFRLEPGRLVVTGLGRKLRMYRDKQAGGLRLRFKQKEGEQPATYSVEGVLPM